MIEVIVEGLGLNSNQRCETAADVSTWVFRCLAA